jgi:hypothetical protein
VGAGAARYFGVDATIARVVAVALLAFGGFGAFLYLAAVVLVPEQGRARPLLGRENQRRSVQVVAIVALAVIGVAMVGAWADFGLLFGGWPLLLLVTAGAAIWFITERGDTSADPVEPVPAGAPYAPHRPATAPDTAMAATGPAPVDHDAAGDGGTDEPTLVAEPGAGPPTPPGPPASRQRGSWGVTFLATGGVFLALAAAIGLEAADVVDLGWGGIAAIAIVLTGIALVASAFYGGARGLIPVGLMLAVVLGGATAAGVSLNGGIGERDYRVADGDLLPARYELGIGHLQLDLRGIELARGVTHVDADLDIGLLEVIGQNARIEDGDASLRSGRDGTGDGGVDVRRTIVVGNGDRILRIDAHVGAGAMLAKRNLGGDDVEWSSQTIGAARGSNTSNASCLALAFATAQSSCEGA